MDYYHNTTLELEPHSGIKFDVSPSGAVTTTSSNRRSLIAPDNLLRSLRERSRDSYQKIRELPRPFQYAATPAAPPLIQTVSTGGFGDHSICEGPVVAPGPSGGRSISGATGCLGMSTGGRCVDEIKKTAKGWVERVEGVMASSRTTTVVERPTEQILRIKNNKTGNCVYLVTKLPSGLEELTPLDSLKHLFPNNKYLRTSLVSWNHHFQNPPQHWLINFIPRAYLRRGFFLAEEICNYLLQYPDGCKYRVEYEPIGHESSLVGTIVPRTLRARAKAGRYWEGREKEIEG
ncbi:uncharacterized protein H6S33_002720 [Morchella sextelata]|uniref:uncharacterized protein n=1 Tax=Morchella sextelata TaxID=1174677 RepID=UPI001D03A7A3|nr:uncharacterized protein H6S33_002720 [Morchella sextelata]KAH0607686.1 hypothetical protein H6S33_002720 [Morchella sextelata]